MSYKDMSLRIGKEEVYLLNDWEEWVLRIPVQSGDGFYFGKFKDGTEYRIKADTNLVAQTMLESKEISKSKEEYERY